MERSEEAIKFLEAKIAETEEELARLQQTLTDVESDLQALRKARDLLVREDAPPKPLRRAGDLPLEEDSPPRPIRKGRELLLEETAPRAKGPPLEEDASPRPVRRGRELLLGETAPPPKPADVRRREPAPPTTTNRSGRSSWTSCVMRPSRCTWMSWSSDSVRPANTRTPRPSASAWPST